MRRRWALAGALLAAAGVGCGIPEHDEATVVADEAVPFGLLEGASQNPLPDPPRSPERGNPVYLLDADDRLIETRRDTGPELEDIVAAVLAGPSADEARLGLHTAVPDPSVVRSVTLAGGVATVDLSEEFADLDGETQRLALAQLVFTLTAQPGVGRVAVTLEGRSVEVPRGDGTLTSGSVSRDAYREVAPRA